MEENVQLKFITRSSDLLLEQYVKIEKILSDILRQGEGPRLG